MKKIYQRAMAVALAGTTLLGAGLWHQHHRMSPAPAKQVTKNTDALPTGVSETTLANIRSSLEKQEYHISYDEQKKKLQSPNRRNNIRAYYEPGKLTVQTRVDTTGDGFKMELVNEGIFADGKLLYTPEMAAKAKHHENQVQISHGAFTEEFINSEDGVRQNFIIENAPEGTRQLQVKMTAKGLKVEQGTGNELRFYSETSKGEERNELVYSDLKCWDANKKPLNATLAYVDNRIQISVDVAGADYPVTIDPIIANGTPQNSNKVLEINQSTMWLGFSVSSAGDVNGDGYSDVIVGAPQYDLGQDNEGGAFVYMGDPSGLTATAVTFQSNQIGAKMGYSVASAGDFNGDGYSDVLAGIPYYDADKVDQGIARLYLGSDKFFTDPIISYNFGQNDHTGALIGISVATAGDVNGDGLSDIIVGASQDSNGENKEGSVAVCYGNANGNPNSSYALLQINLPNAQFGYSIASAGDIDADGFSDIIVGARWYTNGQGQDAEGAAFIYRGGNNGLQGNPTIIEGNQYNAAMGNKVSSAGDVNGDGYSDVLISAYLFDMNFGAEKDHGIVNLYLGSSNGIVAQQQPSRTFYGKNNDHMGSSVACAGDVNGDGYSDILLGAEYYDNGQFNEGGVFVYYGSQGNVGIVGEPVATMESNQADGWFGTAVSSAGDVNGDGYSDILIGCYTFDNGQKDEGHVFVYHGGADGIGTKDAGLITNSKTGAQMGLSVASAGDVNADGYDDVVIGAPYFDDGEASEGVAFVYHGSINGLTTNVYNSKLQKNQANSYFGGAVAGAGDVNGDGYSDILIGSYAFDHGQTDEGQVFVYHGSAGTIGSTVKAVSYGGSGALAGSSVSNAGDLNGDGLNDVIVGAPNYDGGQVGEGATFTSYGDATTGTSGMTKFETNELNAHVGCSVSGAGDIDGDGYDDVIIGAKGAVNGVHIGAAYIFRGGPQGLNTAVSQTLGLAANQGFGTSVSDAGDINRDGYDDVIVGLPSYSKGGANLCGAVYVYLGSGNGLITTPAVLTSGLAGTQIGNSLDNAGDTNGDGYSDIIVGGHLASIGQGSEGAVFIWHGSSSGIASNTIYNKLLQLDQANAEMGNSVAGAGDVNGDGYDDVIVGAHKYDNGQGDEGIAAVYYGSSTGIVTQIKTILEANQSNAYFGRSVGGGVDVNGDGYSDVMVGAPEFDGQSPNGGAVWVFHGSMNTANTTSSFSVTGSQAESHLGEAVTGAGDLNGDGYGDILVGVPGYDQSGVTNGGVAWAYFGNDGYAGKAKRSNLRLYNDDLTTIMNHGQDDEEDFGLGLAITSFLGRNNGRLAWDLAKFGESFSKLPNSPITNSTVPDAFETSFSSLNIPGAIDNNLKEVINKPLPAYAALRVRARIKYELATALTGQVYGPWRYLPGYVIYAPPISPNRENAGSEYEVQQTANLEGEYKDRVSVYPNPVSDRLFIQSTNTDQVMSLQLISANGTMAFMSTKPQSEVDVKHLPAGSYILVIHRKDGSKTSHKVLIRK